MRDQVENDRVTLPQAAEMLGVKVATARLLLLKHRLERLSEPRKAIVISRASVINYAEQREARRRWSGVPRSALHSRILAVIRYRDISMAQAITEAVEMWLEDQE